MGNVYFVDVRFQINSFYLAAIMFITHKVNKVILYIPTIGISSLLHLSKYSKLCVTPLKEDSGAPGSRDAQIENYDLITRVLTAPVPFDLASYINSGLY